MLRQAVAVLVNTAGDGWGSVGDVLDVDVELVLVLSSSMEYARTKTDAQATISF